MRSAEAGSPTLRVPPWQRRRLLAAARAARPREACGVLVGTTAADVGRVDDVIPLANRAADDRRSYRIEPGELEPILRTREVIGVYHSHPLADAEFSARDAQLAWPAWWYVVIGTTPAGRMRLVAWRDGLPERLAGQSGGVDRCPK